MQIREYSLPSGWYPRDPSGVSAEISRFLSNYHRSGDRSRAVVCPHAGWYYCGRIAAIGVDSLEKDAETIAVLGGHLPATSPVLFAMEDAVKTPFDLFPIDKELRSILLKELDGKEDKFRDNTVEVLLPMVRNFFPNTSLLWLRLPAGITSFEAGKAISQAAVKTGRKINVIASTDLTHYGRNYGFLPQGTGEAALRWVREVNDAAFIRAVESGNSGEVLRCAEKDSSACSAGAVLGAMGFSEAQGLGGARLLEYATSADVQDDGEVPDFFVGYAAMAFGK
ncbi:MAG: AmmeMemoRadiSam system protein B [Treponema sp.]|jgi:AmmeMemoRadiSam system protein B|nr:AmmeMemoRadiSam system protein B [Treponema sp.]